MAFTSVENENHSLMKEGEYEVYVNDCTEGTTHSGRECIKFDFVVRSDVDQPYRRKHVFKNFYRGADGQYPVDKIGRYANALGIPKGEEFDLIDLVGKNCRMVIKHFTGDDGVEREAIFFLKPSEVQSYVNTLEDRQFEDMDDEDILPF